MDLSNLKPADRSKHSKKRVGRGHGTGQGTQAGRGHKGAQSRSGYSRKRGFEGGQMPAIQRTRHHLSRRGELEVRLEHSGYLLRQPLQE